MNRLIVALSVFAAGVPAASLTSTCTGTPSVCGGTVIETAAGNLASIELRTRLTSTTAATGTFQLTHGLVTGGPVRSGLVILMLSSSGDYGAGAGSSGTAVFDIYTCFNNLRNGGSCGYPKIVPITLGTTLGVSMSASLTRGAFPPDVIEGAERDLLLQAMFYEDAGGTPGAPVPVSFAPEPASMAMMGAAMLAIVGAVRRRSKS